MKPRRNLKGAFTLIELLASIAILGVMVALLFSAFNQTSKAWLVGENRVETFSNARAALDYMSRELAQAMVNTNTLQFFGTNTAVAFIAPSNDRSGEAVDMAEIVYRLSQPPASAALPLAVIDPGGFFTNTIPPYRLIRRFTPYSETQADCWNYGQPGAPCGSAPWDFYLGNQNWMETAPTNRTAVLADNITSLTFTFVSTNGSQYPFWNSTALLGVWRNEIGNNGIPYNTMDVNGLNGGGCALFMTNHTPAGVIITIGAVDSHTAARLQALAPNGITNAANVGPFTNTLNQAVQLFTTFVEIPHQ